MGFTPAKIIDSPQQGIHENLESVVSKHLKHPFLKPISEHTLKAFELAYQQWQTLGSPPVIFDSGCGTGTSSHNLALQYPDHFVIGLDRSSDRLSHSQNQNPGENLLILQADCTDFWRLADQNHWHCAKHFLIYPNPYPKSEHLKKRWHGHPTFINLLNISQSIELRTNWKIYAEEFATALNFVGWEAGYAELEVNTPISAFEEKYRKSGHALWRIQSIKPKD